MSLKLLYFSPTAAALYGYWNYRLEDGSIVQVTCASDNEDEAARYVWPDKRFVGKGVYHSGRIGGNKFNFPGREP